MKRKFLVLLASLIAVFGTATMALTASATPHTPNPGTSHSGKAVQLTFKVGYGVIQHQDTSGHNSGYCLDDPNDSTTNGTKLQLWQCLSDNSQLWTPVNTSTPNEWEYQNVNGKCVDLTNDNDTNGTPLQIYTCLADDSQLFAFYTFDSTASMTHYNHNLGGYSVDDANDMNANGNKIQIWQNLHDNSQAWGTGF
jgi:hypothetical protein